MEVLECHDQGKSALLQYNNEIMNINPLIRSEEIPLEDFRHSRHSSPASRNSSNAPSRSHTPSRLVTESMSLAKDSTHPVVGTSVDSQPIDQNSKETSFIAHKVKGNVETV